MPLNDPILDATLNHIDLEAIKREMGPPPWSRSIVLADHVRGVVIYQYSGQENYNHCHNYDEWWGMLEGARYPCDEIEDFTCDLVWNTCTMTIAMGFCRDRGLGAVLHQPD